MKQIKTSVYTLVFIIYQKESSTKNEIYQNVYKTIQNKAMFAIVLKQQQLFIKQPEYIIIKLGDNITAIKLYVFKSQ